MRSEERRAHDRPRDLAELRQLTGYAEPVLQHINGRNARVANAPRRNSCSAGNLVQAGFRCVSD